jgi:glycosidase
MRTPLIVLLAITAISVPALAQEAAPRPWNHEVLYSVIIDRFFDADPQNNIPPGSDPELFDAAQQDPARYHGGDLRGLEVAIERGYFTELGVTALCITPPVRHVWCLGTEGGKPIAGFMGHGVQDVLDIDPHFASAASIDGKTKYPATREGRLSHYRDFVRLAHSKGLKVIQEFSCAFTGPVFFYDSDDDGKFHPANAAEWQRPFENSGARNTAWLAVEKWNALKPAPLEPLTLLGHEVKFSGALGRMSAYARRGTRAPSDRGDAGGGADSDTLRMLQTSPDGEDFDDLVNDWVESAAFYANIVGVDGFRFTAARHGHRAFWDAITERLRSRIDPKRTTPLLLIGDVDDDSATAIGRFTVRSDDETSKTPAFDTVMNYAFAAAVRDYLRPVVGPYGSASEFEKGLRSIAANESGRPKFFAPEGPNHSGARQLLVNVIEDHGARNRFLVQPLGEKQSLLANALALLCEGIPCLYYGTETGLPDARGRVPQPGYTGRLTLIPSGKKENLDAIRKTQTYQTIASLAALRTQHAALRDGFISTIWADSPSDSVDDGVMAFTRYTRTAGTSVPADLIVVVINASERARSTSAGPDRMRIVSRSGRPLMVEGQKLVRMPVGGLDPGGAREKTIEVLWHNSIPQVELLLEPQSVNLYRVHTPAAPAATADPEAPPAQQQTPETKQRKAAPGRRAPADK